MHETFGGWPRGPLTLAKRLAGGAGPLFTPLDSRMSFEQVTSARDSLNPVCKELYLTDDDFRNIFGMEKAAFYGMRLWKQRDLKKRVGLW